MATKLTFDDIKDIKFSNNKLTADIKMNRIRKGLQRGQYLLDGQVMTDCVPLMPHVTGNFIQTTRAMSASLQGTGTVIVGSPPSGRFLYYGVVMVGERTNSPWASLGEKKIVTSKPLQYSRPSTKAKWFEEAKKKHLKEWRDLVGKQF